MEFNKTRILRITTVAFIVILLLFAGEWLYSTYTIEKSLLRDLSRKEYVEDIHITREKDEFVISVKLKDVENIKDTYN